MESPGHTNATRQANHQASSPWPRLPSPRVGIIHTDLKPENVLIEIGDVEQIVKTFVKEEKKKDKEDNRNGRRRRRILITGSQPLPSPLNASFNQADLMRFPGSSPASHTSLNQIMHEGNNSPIKDVSSPPLDPVVMSGAIGGSTSKGSSPKTEKEEEEKHKQREKTA